MTSSAESATTEEECWIWTVRLEQLRFKAVEKTGSAADYTDTQEWWHGWLPQEDG